MWLYTCFIYYLHCTYILVRVTSKWTYRVHLHWLYCNWSVSWDIILDHGSLSCMVEVLVPMETWNNVPLCLEVMISCWNQLITSHASFLCLFSYFLSIPLPPLTYPVSSLASLSNPEWVRTCSDQCSGAHLRHEVSGRLCVSWWKWERPRHQWLANIVGWISRNRHLYHVFLEPETVPKLFQPSG